MVEPLDPATLAHLYALPPYRLTKAEVRILVAVARDHARLTAALQEVARVHVPMPGKDPSLCGWCGVLWPCFSRRTADAALSAEAGDTDA
jgi:hypothetical protein